MNGNSAFLLGQQPSLENPRLLVVENEASYSAFLRELLEAEYEVEVAENGEQAWATVQRRLPDLLLTDLAMPLLDGLGLTHRLRADARTASLPIILMTANNQRERLLQALEAGVDDFLLKPFHPLELLARLRCQRRMIALRREAIEEVARKEAEAAVQAKNRFLACLSHELRTPLTPVTLALYLINQKKGLPESVYEGLETIRRNVETEKRLINDLLDYSQIALGELGLSMEPTDLHDCLGQALKECREEFAAKHLKLTVSLSAERHQVRGDAARLKQVFCNLVQNAVKFTPERGNIGVKSANDGDDIVVEVEDDGLGIAAEALPKIFRSFEHGSVERERVYGGLGLGLAIAQAIVTAHEGQLTAASPGLDHGATFRLCLNTKKALDSLHVLKGSFA